jgi:hypothetical protein
MSSENITLDTTAWIEEIEAMEWHVTEKPISPEQEAAFAANVISQQMLSQDELYKIGSIQNVDQALQHEEMLLAAKECYHDEMLTATKESYPSGYDSEASLSEQIIFLHSLGLRMTDEQETYMWALGWNDDHRHIIAKFCLLQNYISSQ